MKLNIDWDGCNYASLNGFHPLFRFMLGDQAPGHNESPRFVVHPFSEKLATYDRLLQPEIKTQLAEIRAAGAGAPAFEWIWKFFDIEEQFLTELRTESAYFCHTFPLSVGIRHFVFHLEDVKLLFLPFAVEFDIDVSAANRHAEFEAYRKFIGNILASDKCMTILCHYQETAAALIDMFQDYALEGKIRMLDLVSLHREYREPLRQEEFAPKRRLLFTHSYHGNVSSIRARGLDAFFDLCRKLAASDLGDRVLPTLLLPSEYRDKLPDDISLEVFHGYLPEDVYESILAETQFHFLASPWIHTKVVVDCIAHGIVPIFRRHAAYCELGFSDLNSINLGSPSYNALTFYDQNELELHPDFDMVIAGMRRFVDAGKIAALVPQQSRDSEVCSSLAEFKRALAELLVDIPRERERKYAGTLQRLSHAHFTKSARFLMHAQFNGLDILTDRLRYLFRRTASPTPASLSDLKYSPHFFRSPQYVVIFDDLTALRAALHWCVEEPSQPVTILYRIKHYLSRHKRLYLAARGVYRWARQSRKIFARRL